MLSTVFPPMDRSVRPRVGQRVSMHFYGSDIPGIIDTVRNDLVKFRPDSGGTASCLRPQSRVTATYPLAHGMIKATLGVLDVGAQLVSMEIVTEPVLLQRRSYPRVAVELPVSLLWRDADHPEPAQVLARTVNLSLGGMLMSFVGAPAVLPPLRTPVLVQLDLPGGPVSAVARLLQIWDDGARGKLLEAEADEAARLGDFIDDRLVRFGGS